jgi:hypothetical protein
MVHISAFPPLKPRVRKARMQHGMPVPPLLGLRGKGIHPETSWLRAIK